MTAYHYTNSQNSIISFGYACWFLSKNLSNSVSPNLKLHNRYCHIPRHSMYGFIFVHSKDLFEARIWRDFQHQLWRLYSRWKAIFWCDKNGHSPRRHFICSKYLKLNYFFKDFSHFRWFNSTYIPNYLQLIFKCLIKYRAQLTICFKW